MLAEQLRALRAYRRRRTAELGIEPADVPDRIREFLKGKNGTWDSRGMVSTERHRTIVDVHALLFDEAGRVLLMERANTGYADGQAGVPSGHLEAGESVLEAVLRETYEEVGVHLAEGDARFVHVSHRCKPGENDRVGFFFAATRWAGEPVNAEPHKCARIWWHDPDDLPSNTVDYIADAIARLRGGGTFSTYGWR